GTEADRPMAPITAIEREMNDEENALVERRTREARASTIWSIATFTVATALAMSLLALGYLLTRRYIGERTRAEATLREGEEKARLILESTGEGLVGLDTTGRCTFSNSAARRILGRAGKDDESGSAGMMGLSLFDLIGEGSAATKVVAALASCEPD